MTEGIKPTSKNFSLPSLAPGNSKNLPQLNGLTRSQNEITTKTLKREGIYILNLSQKRKTISSEEEKLCQSARQDPASFVNQLRLSSSQKITELIKDYGQKHYYLFLGILVEALRLSGQDLKNFLPLFKDIIETAVNNNELSQIQGLIKVLTEQSEKFPPQIFFNAALKIAEKIKNIPPNDGELYMAFFYVFINKSVTSLEEKKKIIEVLNLSALAREIYEQHDIFVVNMERNFSESEIRKIKLVLESLPPQIKQLINGLAVIAAGGAKSSLSAGTGTSGNEIMLFVNDTVKFDSLGNDQKRDANRFITALGHELGHTIFYRNPYLKEPFDKIGGRDNQERHIVITEQLVQYGKKCGQDIRQNYSDRSQGAFHVNYTRMGGVTRGLPDEDFATCVEAYFYDRQEFLKEADKRKAMGYPILREKYDFMARLFGNYGYRTGANDLEVFKK